MSAKHLVTGDPMPPATKDTLRLYTMRFCPYAERARLVLAHKGIKYETVNVALNPNKPEWFATMGTGAVPVIEINGKIIYESLVVCEYLEEMYPEKPLLPKDPWERAHIRVLMQRYGSIISKYYAIRRIDGDALKTALAEMHDMFPMYEEELGDKKFYGGEAPNMLDYMMWPWLARIHLDMEYIFPQNRFPKLRAWWSRMRENEIVQTVGETLATHMDHFIRALKKDYATCYDFEPLPEIEGPPDLTQFKELTGLAL